MEPKKELFEKIIKHQRRCSSLVFDQKWPTEALPNDLFQILAMNALNSGALQCGKSNDWRNKRSQLKHQENHSQFDRSESQEKVVFNVSGQYFKISSAKLDNYNCSILSTDKRIEIILIYLKNKLK